MGWLKDIFISVALGALSGGLSYLFSEGLKFWVLVGRGALIGGGMAALGSLLARDQPSFASQVRDRKVTIRAATQPLRVIYGEVKVGGVLVYAESNGNKNEFMHMVLALAGHEVNKIGEIYFNDRSAATDPSGSVKWADWTKLNRHAGGGDQEADADLVAASDKWTAAHRGGGIAYIYARLKYDREGNVWPTGLPNITAVVQGRKVWDPRAEATAYSSNPALCVLDYLRNPDWGLGAADDELDIQSFRAGADYCDAAPADGEDAKRFTCNGSFNADAKPREILEQLLSSCGGSLTYSRGRFRFCAGAGETVMTLGGDDLRGDLSVVPRPSRGELFNAVGGTFSDKAQNWVSQEFPETSDRRYRDEDGGEKLVRKAEFAFTTSRTEAIRLAGIALQTARQSAVVEFPANLAALSLKVWDVVALNIPHLGYDNKRFRVVSWRLADDGGVDLTLAEYSPNAYEWAGDFPESDPAPDTSLPDPWLSPPPERLRLASGDAELLVGGDGTVISRIRLSWDEPSGVTMSRWEVAWKLAGDAKWQSLTVRQPEAFVSPVRDAAAYDLRVRGYNTFGVASQWLTFRGYRVLGKSAPPPKPDWFRVAQMADGTRQFTWGLRALPADVRAGGGFTIRYGGRGTVWANMQALHEGLLVSSPYESNALAAGAYTFGIKSRDSSGNYSRDAVYITAVLGDPRLKDVLFQRRERAEGWLGAKGNCFVAPGGELIAASRYKIKDLPSKISGLTGTVYGLGGAPNYIAYVTPWIDLGAALTFTPLVSVKGRDVGGATLTLTYKLQAQGTAKRLNLSSAGVVTARYFQVALGVAASRRSLKLEDLVIICDGEARTTERNDLDTATASEAWYRRVSVGRFLVAADGIQLITQASITALQDAEPGWSWTLKRKDGSIGGTPAAEFQVWDASRQPTDAVVDISLRGPASKEAANA